MSGRAQRLGGKKKFTHFRFGKPASTIENYLSKAEVPTSYTLKKDEIFDIPPFFGLVPIGQSYKRVRIVEQIGDSEIKVQSEGNEKIMVP